MISLDRRLLGSALAITVSTLVSVWAEHCPRHLPVPEACPSCGHVYRTDAPLCPSASVVWPLLQRRRHEQPKALSVLTFNQEADLLAKRPNQLSTYPVQDARCAQPARTPALTTGDLFDVSPYRRTGGPR